MKLNKIGYYEINFVDSAATNRMKTGSGAGESRLYLGQVSRFDEIYDFFSEDVRFYFFCKNDLLNYLRIAKEEYFNPTQEYREKKLFPKFYQENLQEIQVLEEDYLEFNFTRNYDSSRCFIRLVEDEYSNDNYEVMRKICIPKMTKLAFIKYVNQNNNAQYIKVMPIFSKPYTAQELGAILKKHYENSEQKNVEIHLFVYDYGKYIIEQNLSLDIIIREAKLNDNEAGILHNAIEVFKRLYEDNISVNASETIIVDDGEYEVIKDNMLQLSLPFQQIFYGAPGTGKSHKVKEVTDTIAKEFVFRTTFHPDSDYSTFVGAYKPTMEDPNNKAYTVGQLIDKLSEIKNTGCTYPCQKFAAKYWYALKQLSATEIKEIISACGFTDSMKVEIDKSIPVGEELAKHNADSKIVYSFVPQAFLKAYVAAWKNKNQDQPVFLVIEEINRGNCAQIFGDIFQLLDRKDGVSEYPIKADQDIRDYLAKEFAGYDLEANILSGEELVLPANLHIWATMNTSDQSLFPIDSAFKRRWDWKYMPIHDAGENWTIALSDVEYDWWDFVEKINNVIGNMTSSEDKKLGYFFCKACNGKIDAEKFVNKVVFYLWNDVFKDYELSDKAFQDGEGKLTFNKFYTPLGDANEATIKTLMENLGVSTSDLISEIDEEAVNLSKDDLSALQQKRLDFWTRYLKYAQNNADYMQYFGSRQTPTKNYYCQFHVLQKKGYLCVVIKHKANKLFVKYETMDEQLYNTLYSHKEAIQSELGDINLTWEGKVGTRERIDIYAEHNVDFNNEQSIFNLIIDRLLRMREVFDKYLNN